MKPELTDALFRLCNLIAMLGWVGLILFPEFILTRKLIRSGALSAVFGILYGGLVLLGGGINLSSFQSIAGVQGLFQNPIFLLVGWIHYLAFDLLVGVWMVGDAKKNGIRHWHLAAPLVLTFLFGPVGFVTYLLLRRVKRMS